MKAKTVSNWVKIIIAALVVIINIGYLLFHKKIMGLEEQKSLLMVAGFVFIVFSPIDLSLIAKNIFQKQIKNLAENVSSVDLNS